MAALVAVLFGAATALPCAIAAAEPAIAAHFRMEVRPRGGPPLVHEWRLWRSADEVVRQQMPAGEIEQWQRDGNVILHRRLYPDERRGIELQPADLAMLGGVPRWEDVAGVVPLAIRSQLTCAAPKVARGVPLQTCKGTVEGARWRVQTRTDLDLPVSVVRSDRRGRERLTLVATHALAAAPWPRPDAGHYDVMDFADLGDHEHDDFARRVERLIGIAHRGHGW